MNVVLKKCVYFNEDLNKKREKTDEKCKPLLKWFLIASKAQENRNQTK